MRQPPFRKSQVDRRVKSALALRRNADPGPHNNCKLNRGGIVMLLDGGTHATGDFVGNKLMVASKGRWQTASKLENLKQSMAHARLSEGGLTQRRGKAYGVAAQSCTGSLQLMKKMAAWA